MTAPSSSYASGTSTAPLLGRTIGADLGATVARFGDREALVDVPSGRRWTYRQLDAEVDRVARGMVDLGIEKGDRVGIWSPNCAEWVFVQYATSKIGAILVNVNPAYRSHELQFVLRQSGTKLLVAAPSFKTSDYGAMIDEVRGDCPMLEASILLGSADWDDQLARGDRNDGGALAARTALLGFDDPINIQYTSGTTGFPKGATLSHHNILNNGYFVGELLGYTEEDRVCLPVPFYHCFGMVMGNLGSTSHGSCIVIPAQAFEPAATLQAVQDERCTSLYGVPTMFIAELALADFPTYDLAALRTGIMAGSPCPVEVMKRRRRDAHGRGHDLLRHDRDLARVDDDSTRRRSRATGVDRRNGHAACRSRGHRSDSGLPAPRGVPGELCTRGYSVMLGYWDEPGLTAESVDTAGWMHSGDLATMDEDGYVAIVGRIKDMVIRGGENVYPREVEEFLYAHPDIEDVQVIGVPDEKYGEELMAWVRLRPDADVLTVDALCAYCEGKLAHYKVPRYLHLTEEFPMTVTGKIRKIEMCERSVDLLGLGCGQ